METTLAERRIRVPSRGPGRWIGPAQSVARGAWMVRARIAIGVAAATLLFALYIGVVALAQGWDHATRQLSDDRWFVLAIMLGFGAQAGLYAHVRALHRRLSAGGVAASGGTSATAMLACCAHHVADALPILGISAAAVFLNAWRTELLWLGALMNLAGVVYLAVQAHSAERAVRGTEHAA
ncbi:MAG: hypothetical protein EPO26_06740 [Chloroflexota bacterium]|nr:MAG: hypothetical protein EPO26_06740 [Chloroflexota bacterium]